MGKVLLIGDVCVQNDIEIDNSLLKIVKEEVDFSICNLEGYFSDNKDKCKTLGISYHSFEKFASEMKIKAVSIANNHINDGGKKLHKETCRLLRKLNIKFFGNKKNSCFDFTLNGKKTSIIFSVWRLTGKNLNNLNMFWFNLKSLKKEIKKNILDKKFVIWFPHWGVDSESLPHPWQVQIAKKMVNLGINMIFGHHSHIIQPNLYYKDSPVIFCSGNFIMPENKLTSYYSKNMKKGLSILLDFNKQEGEQILTKYNNSKIYLLERKEIDHNNKEMFKSDKNYLIYFRKNHKKAFLPIYGSDNTKNYFKSIYHLALMYLTSFTIFLNLWKRIRFIICNEK